MHKGSLRTGILLFLEEMEALHGGMTYKLQYKQAKWPGYPNKTWHEIVQRMIEDGELKESKEMVGMTVKGKARVYGLQPARMYAAKKWDGKWRMVIFEIPEKKRVKRNQLRNVLVDMGFGRWQRSMYVHPYPMTGFVEEYAKQLGVMGNVTHWEAEIAGKGKNKELASLVFDQEKLVEAGKKLEHNKRLMREYRGKKLEEAERKWIQNWQKFVFADPMLPKRLQLETYKALRGKLLEVVEKMVVGK